MSNFLQIVQDLRAESTDSGSGPSTIVGATGEHGRFVLWVKDGYVELQNERDDFLWMRKSFYVDTVASDGEYAYTDCTDTVTLIAITRFARWYRDCFKAYLVSTGVGAEYPLIWLDWETFRRVYRYGTQNDGMPIHVSMDPTMAFVLGPKPSAIYRVSGDYQLGPQILALDEDIPELPTRFHKILTYYALSKYGGSRVAPEVMLRASAEGGRLRAMLELDQLPSMGFAPPLA